MMINVTLPSRLDREVALGFWISLVVVAGVSLGVLLAAAGWLSLSSAVVVILTTLGTLTAGLFRERFVRRAYHLWNRAARGYARRARAAVTALWYYIVFGAVGRLAGTMDSEGSRWLPRDTLPASGYRDPGGITRRKAPTGTLRDFSRWALRSGQAWMLFLLPLFVIVRMLDPKAGKAAAPDIYTLY